MSTPPALIPMNTLEINGVPLQLLGEDPFYYQVKHEIENVYQFDSIPFQPGDIVLDIGAHVGLVSMYLASKFPGITVYAYEPVEENFARLIAHLDLNDLPSSVKPHNLAVTADGGDRVLVHGVHHSGGATAFHDFDRESFTVPSTTIPAILKGNRIERVRLLKLDCEGAEHEILGTSSGWLDRVQSIRGEIHRVLPDGREEWYRSRPVQWREEYDAVAATQGLPDALWTFA